MASERHPYDFGHGTEKIRERYAIAQHWPIVPGSAVNKEFEKGHEIDFHACDNVMSAPTNKASVKSPGIIIVRYKWQEIVIIRNDDRAILSYRTALNAGVCPSSLSKLAGAKFFDVA